MSTVAPAFELRFSANGSAMVTTRGGVFVRRSGFHVDTRAVETPFSSYLPPALADLVEVAMAVYTADRLCPRRLPGGNRYDHRWHRRLQLEIPVRAPDRWQSEELATQLRDLLAFMTDDDWDFQFTQREGPSQEVQGHLFDSRPLPPFTVALFSGGLDSLAGLCIEALERPSDAFVLFSGWTNSRLASQQHSLSSALAGRIGRRVIPVRVPFGITHDGSHYNEDEPTQRTRGFVFCLLGAAVALNAGTDTLVCYENGIGAFNLPITDAQLGAQNARSAHPVGLAEVADLVESAVGRRFRMRLPFLFRTKAELCEGLREAGLSDLVSATVSCDAFPRRVKGEPQCGICTTCILRRQALHVAALSHSDPPDQYAFDVHSAKREDLPYELHAMLDQAWRIGEALGEPDQWARLTRLYPQLESTVCALTRRGWDAEQLRNGIVELLERYCRDWAAFTQPELPFSSSTFARSSRP